MVVSVARVSPPPAEGDTETVREVVGKVPFELETDGVGSLEALRLAESERVLPLVPEIEGVTGDEEGEGGPPLTVRLGVAVRMGVAQLCEEAGAAPRPAQVASEYSTPAWSIHRTALFCV